jgi:ABC-type lipoprotein export system ATPase subunit
MRELNEKKGLTLVIVTHDPGVGAQADRIVYMRDGQIEQTTADVAVVTDAIAAD